MGLLGSHGLPRPGPLRSHWPLQSGYLRGLEGTSIWPLCVPPPFFCFCFARARPAGCAAASAPAPRAISAAAFRNLRSTRPTCDRSPQEAKRNAACAGRCAARSALARSGALQTRDPSRLRVWNRIRWSVIPLRSMPAPRPGHVPYFFAVFLAAALLLPVLRQLARGATRIRAAVRLPGLRARERRGAVAGLRRWWGRVGDRRRQHRFTLRRAGQSRPRRCITHMRR